MGDSIFNTTPRRTKFIETYKQTGDQKFAAGVAWPELPEKRRERFVKRVILTQPQINAKLEQNGLGIGKLMKRHAAALNAKKLVSINGWVEEVDDHDVQMKAVEKGYQLHRILKDTNTPEAAEVNITIDPGRLAEVAARLEAVNKKMLPNHTNTVEAEIVRPQEST